MPLPALTGSPKQVAAAERVRAAALAAIAAVSPADAVEHFAEVASQMAFNRKVGTPKLPYVAALADDGTMAFGKDYLDLETISEAGVMAVLANARRWLEAETSAAAIMDRLVSGTQYAAPWTRAVLRAEANAASVP